MLNLGKKNYMFVLLGKLRAITIRKISLFFQKRKKNFLGIEEVGFFP